VLSFYFYREKASIGLELQIELGLMDVVMTDPISDQSWPSQGPTIGPVTRTIKAPIYIDITISLEQ
jgi:hypothetical protein